MRKTENIILTVLGWLHASLLFATLYLFLPSYLDKSMERFYPGVIGFINKGDAANLLHAIVVVVPVIVSFFLLRVLRNIILYLITAASVCVILFKLTNNVITLVCCVLIFLIRCQSKIEKGRIAKRLRDYPGEFGRMYAPQDWEIPTLLDRPRPVHWIFFIMEYMLLILTGRHQNLTGIFLLLFAEILVTMLFMYVDRMKAYIISHEKIASLPGKMILRNGYAILVGVTLMILLLMIPSVLYGREPLTGLYHERKPGKVWELPIPEQEEHTDDELMKMLMQLQGEQKPLPAWVGYLNQFIMWVITAIIVVFAVKMLFTLLTGILSSFAEGEEDEVISLKELQEEEKRVRREKKKKERELRGTADYRIRRKYKKRILKASKEKPLGIETPEELEEHARLMEQPDNRRLRALYEKARYSQEECTVEEEKSFPG